MDIKGVELFRTGRWNDIKNFTVADLEAMASSFAELRMEGRVPLKFGHNEEQALTDGQPALGWLDRVWVDGETLKGDFTSMPRVVYDAIKAGRYKFVSVELLRDVIYRGREFPWVLSAVALLGADIPAVSGLKDLQALAMSRRTGFRSGAKLTFTRAVRSNSTNGGRKTMSGENEPTLQDVLKRLDGLTGKVETLSTENATLKADNDRLKREAKDAADARQAEKVQQHRNAIKERFDAAIKTKVIRPSAREMFEKQPAFKDDKSVLEITLDFVDSYIKENTVAGASNSGNQSGGNDSRDSAEDDSLPFDQQVVKLTRKRMGEAKCDYFTAQREVLRENPELADKYRHMPGTTGGKAA